MAYSVLLSILCSLLLGLPMAVWCVSGTVRFRYCWQPKLAGFCAHEIVCLLPPSCSYGSAQLEVVHFISE